MREILLWKAKETGNGVMSLNLLNLINYRVSHIKYHILIKY